MSLIILIQFYNNQKLKTQVKIGNINCNAVQDSVRVYKDKFGNEYYEKLVLIQDNNTLKSQITELDKKYQKDIQFITQLLITAQEQIKDNDTIFVPIVVDSTRKIIKHCEDITLQDEILKLTQNICVEDRVWISDLKYNINVGGKFIITGFDPPKAVFIPDYPHLISVRQMDVSMSSNVFKNNKPKRRSIGASIGLGVGIGHDFIRNQGFLGAGLWGGITYTYVFKSW